MRTEPTLILTEACGDRYLVTFEGYGANDTQALTQATAIMHDYRSAALEQVVPLLLPVSRQSSVLLTISVDDVDYVKITLKYGHGAR